MTNTTLSRAIELLQDALRDATMQNASFAELHEPLPVILKTREEIDAYIKKRIDLWLATWIAGPMKHAVEILAANKELLDANDKLNDALFNSELGRAVKRMDTALARVGSID
jgi:hypothetical protein